MQHPQHPLFLSAFFRQPPPIALIILRVCLYSGSILAAGSATTLYYGEPGALVSLLSMADPLTPPLYRASYFPRTALLSPPLSLPCWWSASTMTRCSPPILSPSSPAINSAAAATLSVAPLLVLFPLLTLPRPTLLSRPSSSTPH